jgi:hypothetical protein
MDIQDQYEVFLKKIVHDAEQRYIWYKKQMGELHKMKLDMDDPFNAWYKEFLREMKNSEEAWLNKSRDEVTFYRQGLNPPFCYPKKKDED